MYHCAEASADDCLQYTQAETKLAIKYVGLIEANSLRRTVKEKAEEVIKLLSCS